MPAGLKLALAAEILVGYITARRLMPRHDLRHVVLAMRPPEAAPAANGQREPEETTLVAKRLGYAVTRTLRRLPTDSRCLVQALVLSHVLSQRGIDSTLVIGARSAPDFAAHAWVEHAGQPVLSPAGYDESRLVEL